MKIRTAATRNMGVGCNCVARSRVVPARSASGYNARRAVQRLSRIAPSVDSDVSAERFGWCMRIVMLAPFGIRPKGTLAARMLPLAQALVRRGHRVVIVAPPVHNPNDAATCVEYDGVPVIHTAAPRAPGVAQQTLALLQETLRQRPDVVHLFKPKGYAGLAALALHHLRPALPLVVDTDDWEGPGGWNDLLPYPSAAKRLFAWQERDLLRRADAITVASRALETLVWSMGIAPERVFYLPNGVKPSTLDTQRSTFNLQRSTFNVQRSTFNVQQPSTFNLQRSTFNLQRSTPNPQPSTFNLQPSTFNLQPSTFNLLLYTRFWELDVREVVAALVGVAARRPDVRLIVVGKGERGEENELLRLVQRAGLAPFVDYRGWLMPDHIPATLAEADVALMPMRDTLINRARGLAKLLELMGAGLPIVASRVGQAAEYLEHGVSGWLVPPGNPGALAEAVLRLIGDADLRQRLGIGAQYAARQYSWDLLAPIAERAYAHAVNRSYYQFDSMSINRIP
jgi:glycosyltransferase involved in cell wall biosynthesis